MRKRLRLPAGTAFGSLSFLSSDFSISGNSLGISNRIFVGPQADGAAIAAPIALHGAMVATTVGGPLSFFGEISGSGSLTGNGNGVFALWGSGLVTSSVAGAVTLTVDTTNYPGTFSGVIEDGSGTMALTKIGTGTLVLSGTNTYSGGTTISAGTIYVGNWGATGTLGSGAIVNHGSLVFQRSGTTTVADAISGSGTVTQANGTLTLTGANTYTGGTTIIMGATLRVGGANGTLGSGEVTGVYDPYHWAAQLVFERSTDVTVNNDISGFLELVQQGAGTVVLTGSNTYDQNTTIGSGSTLCIGDGGTVTLTDSLTNEGTLRVVGAAVVTDASRRISGNAAAVSAGEVFLSSTGLASESATLEFEISTDGVNYYSVATGGETDAQAMLSGLRAETEYYLRGRAIYGDGSQEIYDGGIVSTLEGPGPGVADASGWYRINAIRYDYSSIVLEPAPGSTAYVEPRELPPATAAALLARDPRVHVFGQTGSPPFPSEQIFHLDKSWFFAESPQAAVLKAVVGLVQDQSVPILTNGVVKVWRVLHIAHSQEVLFDTWTFDEGKYPVGGYSDSWYSYPYTVGLEKLDASVPCPDPSGCCPTGGPSASLSDGSSSGGAAGDCGAPAPSGAVAMPMPAIISTGGPPSCGGGSGGLTYSSREVSMDTGFGPGWSDADELPSTLKKKCKALDVEVRFRQKYLDLRCDYVLTISIGLGSENKEKGHKEELDGKTVARDKCWKLYHMRCAERTK